MFASRDVRLKQADCFKQIPTTQQPAYKAEVNINIYNRELIYWFILDPWFINE